MRKIIDVLVVEDNEYYNNILSGALRRSRHFSSKNRKYKLVLHSIMDSSECIQKINSDKLKNNDVIAFVDHSMNRNIPGTYILNLLKGKSNNSLLILLSQSGLNENNRKSDQYDFIVKKDQFAPALCRLYFEQFMDNNY